MPTRAAAPSGTPCWIDLFTGDTDRAKQFYGAIFGWEPQEAGPEYGGYVNFTKNGVLVAGMMHNDGTAGTPDLWNTYLSVPDVKATTEAAVAGGAQVYAEPMQVMELGSMAVLGDPSGAAIGLWQPGLHKGYGLVAEAGVACWHELITRDYATALEFYRTALGWETQVVSDTDDFRYAQLVVDGSEYAGVMDGSAFLPEGVPSSWLVYFGAEDVDATLAQAVDLGGQVAEPAHDTPYGRLAALTDPTGAYLKLVGVPTS